MIATELTEMFGLQHPIILAPMGGRIRWTSDGHCIERRWAGVGRRGVRRSSLAEDGVVSRHGSDAEALGRRTDHLVGESKRD